MFLQRNVLCIRNIRKIICSKKVCNLLIFNNCSFVFIPYFRYATTLITSKVANPQNYSREVFMSVILPETAFISRFAIQVEDQVFVAFVKEKEDAWRQYQDAVTKGKTAGN